MKPSLGHNEVTKLEISDCSGDLCKIKKGTKHDILVDFVANQDTANLTITMTARVAGEDFNVPGIDSNGCNHVECPLVSGKKYTLKSSLSVPKLVPSIKTDVTAKMTGKNGVVACGTIHVVIV